jgi:cell division protein ZapB
MDILPMKVASLIFMYMGGQSSNVWTSDDDCEYGLNSVIKCLNLLTKIRLQNYSDKMISEFHELPDKIKQLAELTQFLRLENADLRLKMAMLSSENASLCMRMQEAHQRVSALLEKIPALVQDEEFL